MRTWITIFVITVLIVTIAVGEKIYVSKFSNEMEKILFQSKSKIVNKENIESEIEKLYDLWNKSKTTIFSFTNHNLYSTIDELLIKLKYYSSYSDYDNLYMQIMLFEIEKDKLRETLEFNFGNIF